MGSCISCDASIVDKVHDVGFDECNKNNDIIKCEHGGDQIMLRGSSNFVSMYCQKGTKGLHNQDAMTVWKDFAGDKDTIFCGVFDGHGPLGHKFSYSIRDNLPSKLSTIIKLSQQKLSKQNGPNAKEKSSYGDLYSNDDEINQQLSIASWEGSFLRSFNEMDKYLAKNVDTDGFCGGSVAVTLIKKGDQLIIGNLGDSRAVLCTKADDNHLIPIQLSVDLIPDVPSEAKRVIKCGGRVFATKQDPTVNRIWMPEGDCPGLAMTRAFGDFCLKDYGLSSIPDVSYRKLTKQDEFVVLATDGIWNVLTNMEVITIVASAPKRSLAAKLLVKRAVQVWKQKYPRHHIDDCAAICLFFNENARGNKRYP